jgi:membrane AbrB-like protein
VARSTVSRRLCSFQGRAAGSQWASLLVLSVVFVPGLQALHLPAAMLLGPMFAGIAVAAAGATVRVPVPCFLVAQAVVGCMLAGRLPPSLGAVLLQNWPLFAAGVVSVVVAANLLGLLLTRWRVLPGTTAIWGSAPGAAMAMVVMAGEFGADMRLVAFMQYLRVVCVTLVATLVARLWIAGPGGRPPEVVWFPPIAWEGFVGTLVLIGLAPVLARRLHVPGGAMLLPLAIGLVLKGGGWMTVVTPPWLLALGYALVGWSVGLRFTRPVLAHAARAMPKVLASTMALIAICGAFAAVLVVAGGIDPLTAYLATSPGGADSVAIIAASSNVDLPFVVAMQMARFLVVLLVGPAFARLVARTAGLADTAR